MAEQIEKWHLQCKCNWEFDSAKHAAHALQKNCEIQQGEPLVQHMAYCTDLAIANLEPNVKKQRAAHVRNFESENSVQTQQQVMEHNKSAMSWQYADAGATLQHERPYQMTQ